MLKSRGSYNIQAATVSLQQKPLLKSGELECIVQPLGRDRLDFIIKKKSIGSEIFFEVTRILELEIEQDYFGLRMNNGKEADLHEPIQWLDLTRTLSSQSKKRLLELDFCVQYYPIHPERLFDEYTRYLFFLQIREDLFLERLRCTHEAKVMLLAYTAQSVLGNYDSNVHKHGYIADLPLLPRMSEDQLNSVFLRHVELVDMTAGEAENAFLLLASQQGMYGLDIHLAENTRAGSNMLVGVGAQGLALFTLETVSFAPFDTIRWQTIRSTKFRGKNFYVYPVSFDSSRPEKPIEFRCRSRRYSKLLWKSVVRHHAFFRVKKSASLARSTSVFNRVANRRTPIVRAGFFGMTHDETMTTAERSMRSPKSFNRSGGEFSPTYRVPPGSGPRSRVSAFIEGDSLMQSRGRPPSPGFETLPLEDR